MRVLTVGNMYPPHHLGGYELMWRSCVEHLRDRGHEVRVLTTDYRGKQVDAELAGAPAVHRELRWYWRDHAFPPLSFPELARLERHNARVLQRHLAELRPDVVNWWAMGGMSLSLIERVRLEERASVGVVVDDWMIYGQKVDAWQRLAARLGPARALLRHLTGVPTSLDLDSAGRWLFVSETVRGRAREAGWTVPDSSVAQGGVDGELFGRAARHPWSGRLLYVGRLDPRKGIHVAIEALAHLPDATLEVVGDGDPAYRAELESRIRDRDLEGRVRFSSPPRSELPATYAGADALLFPVLWEEPWGLVPLEAMSIGIPVVATGTGGSGEYLRHGENCLLYDPPDEPRRLAEAVQALAGDGSLRDRLREGGLSTARRLPESRFNETVSEALEQVAPSR